MQGHGDHLAVCEPERKQAPFGHQILQYPDLRLPASRTVGNKFPLFINHLSLWFSVLAPERTKIVLSETANQSDFLEHPLSIKGGF